MIAVAQEAETGKNVGVTVLGKNGLSFHIEFLYLDAVLLKVEKEMWKSTDFDSDFTDSVDFQKKLMFPHWILTVEWKLIVSFTSLKPKSVKSI